MADDFDVFEPVVGSRVVAFGLEDDDFGGDGIAGSPFSSLLFSWLTESMLLGTKTQAAPPSHSPS